MMVNVRKIVLFEYQLFHLAEHDFVVVKDLAYYFKGKTSSPEFLPQGFIHLFLIRNPTKSIPSMYNILQTDKEKGEVHQLFLF